MGHYRSGDYQAAVRCFERLIQDRPANVLACLWLSDCHRQAGQWSRAAISWCGVKGLGENNGGSSGSRAKSGANKRMHSDKVFSCAPRPAVRYSITRAGAAQEGNINGTP